MMIEVKVKEPYNEENFKKALTNFKKICKKDGFIKIIHENRYALSKGEKKRRKTQKNQRQKIKCI